MIERKGQSIEVQGAISAKHTFEDAVKIVTDFKIADRLDLRQSLEVELFEMFLAQGLLRKVYSKAESVLARPGMEAMTEELEREAAVARKGEEDLKSITDHTTRAIFHSPQEQEYVRILKFAAKELTAASYVTDSRRVEAWSPRWRRKLAQFRKVE